MKNTRSFAAVAAIGACTALVLSSCSDDKKSDDNSTSASATASTSGSSTSKGESKISLDGKDWPGPFTAHCAKTGNNIALAISTADNNAAKGAGATVTSDNKVTTLAIGNATQGGVGFAEGVPGGEAKLTRKDNTFTIEGEATGIDLSNPTAPKKTKFVVVFACDSVVGG